MKNCRLCDRFILSDSVTFSGGNLLVDIPAGNYGNKCRFCIVVAQAIPAATTINAPVYVTIGGVTTTLYPLVKRNCVQATACSIRTRTVYPVCVVTTPTGGSFRLQANVPCAPNNALASLPAPATAAPAAGDGA